MSVNRRNFLRGAAGTLAAAGALGVSRPALAEGKGGGGSPDPATVSVPFLGANQAGVYRPDFLQRSAGFAAFRLLVEDRAGLQALLQTLTSHIQSLTEGSLVDSGPPRESEIGGLDSGVLGAQVPPDALTVTVGLGAGVFTDRYGLAAARPRGLTTMPVFPSDSPEPDWTGGDLVLQVCSNASDSVHHALRDLTRATRGMMQLEWKILGFHSGPRPTGAPRNLFGYKDGIVNPAEDEGLVWIDKNSGQPDWAVGGSFLVIRLIRMLVEFWDRVGIPEQNAIIGRDRDSGAPLDGTGETDLPDYPADPDGAVIPLDAHIRLANPRTAETDRSRLLRRGYNYENAGMSRNGNSETGLIFCSYQQNIQDQFEATQLRLAGEPMTDYIQPFGGGYFVVPPGVAEFGGYLGEGMFA
ncbi:Dyp-type peroxidase [Jatrophihabitans sp.]|uniref:Dyp-type peroxidase n=1 Tax=Jatrophihabitans sp. TaxID=1932789 RepID=UPI002C786A86|nr:Dyp-type peroxidase [Jatrophihabitans sp.]